MNPYENKQALNDEVLKDVVGGMESGDMCPNCRSGRIWLDSANEIWRCTLCSWGCSIFSDAD